MNYSEIWTALKAGKQVDIEVEKSAHKKILRRLRHESHKDRIFRLVCAENNQAFKFITVSLGDKLCIHLSFVSRDTMPKRFL